MMSRNRFCRKLAALKGLLEMTKNFPKQTVADDDMFDKLHKIRAKFKQVGIATTHCVAVRFQWQLLRFALQRV